MSGLTKSVSFFSFLVDLRSVFVFPLKASVRLFSFANGGCCPVPPSDHGELGEKQTEGSGAVRPRPPHERQGQRGGRHCRPAGGQPVSQAQAGDHIPNVGFDVSALLFETRLLASAQPSKE